MGKAIERPLQPDAMIGRFHVAFDDDGEPADWDCTVARFLLAVTARDSSASAVAPTERASAAISLLEPHRYSGLNLLPDSCMVQGIRFQCRNRLSYLTATSPVDFRTPSLGRGSPCEH
jgi:hypothetical protein